MIQSLCTAIRQGASPSFDEVVTAFSDRLPLIGSLAETEQDSEWHAEGNVHIHTAWVLQELYKLLSEEPQNLNPDQRLTLVLATAFHDIGKRTKTRTAEIDNRTRVVSPHHEEAGASYLATRLLECGLAYDVLHPILQLVATHHLPKRLVMRNEGPPAYANLARQVDLQLLYYLAKADMRGRSCPDKTQQIEAISLFRLFAEDYTFYGVRDAYSGWTNVLRGEMTQTPVGHLDYVMGYGIQAFEEGLIQSPHEALARAYGHLKNYPELVVLCGMSGSGKSFWTKQHLPEHQVVSMDELRDELTRSREVQRDNNAIYAKARDILRSHLRADTKIVWDATSLRRDGREKVIRAACDYHALVTLVVFHVDERTLRTRNRSRAHPVPDEVITAQLERFQWPMPTEAHRLLVVGRDGNTLHSAGFFEG